MGGSGQVRNLFRKRIIGSRVNSSTISPTISTGLAETRRHTRQIMHAQPQHASRSPNPTLLWKKNAYSTVIRTSSSMSNAPTNQPSSSSDLAELHRWTETVLNPHKTPLGSLDAAAWNDIMTALQFFLDDATTTAPPPPRHVDLCDKLLARLWMEHKSCGGGSRRRTSPLRHQQQQEWLHAWSFALRDAWLRVAREHPRAPLPVQRARVWWEQQQAAGGGRDNNNMNIDALFVAQQLVEAELRLTEAQPKGSPHAVPACLRATEMLLSNALVDELLEASSADRQDQSTASTAAAAFKEYYKQAVRLNLHHFSVSNASGDDHDNLSMAVSNLLEQMEQLSQQPGWEDVRFENEELDQILDTLFLESSSSDDILATDKDNTSKSLSDFEEQALRQRILARIRNATRQQEEANVEELVLFWRNNMDQLSAELAQEVAAFYLRIEDPEKSTKWLQIQDGLPTASEKTKYDEESLAASGPQMDGALEGATEVTFDPNQSAVTGTSERERYAQKINLLNVWVSKTDAPSAPYRATEILESLEAEETKTLQQLDAKPYISIVRMWLEQPGGSQKALKIATRCPVFDATLLSLVFKALTEEHKSGRINRETATKMVDLWKSRCDDIPSDMHSSLAEDASVMMAAGGIEKGHELVPFLLQRGESLSAVVCENTVRASPPNKVVELIDLLETKSNSLATITFDCYRFAVFRLLQGNAPLSMIQDFFARVLQAATTSEAANSKRGEAADLFLEILRRGQKKDESALGDLLSQTEEVLVDSAGLSADTTSSPISLEFFQKVFHLFEQKQMLDEMEKLFLRLKEYHRNGLEDLHPDGSMYRSYARLLQKVQSVDSLDKRLELLTELMEFYEASGKAPQFKPSYDVFDGVVGGLRLRCKTYSKSEENKKAANENYDRDTRTALSLVDKMHQLHIVPENLDRVYVFNITMEIVLGSQKKETCFETVMELKRKMLDLGLQPNHLTHIAIVRAAEFAPPGKAVPVTLESLAEIRRANKADAPLYMSCFCTLLKHGRGSETASSLDKVAAMVFECCCNDGALTSYVKKSFQRLCSKDTVDRLYTKRLEKDSKEPASWTRKAGNYF